MNFFFAWVLTVPSLSIYPFHPSLVFLFSFSQTTTSNKTTPQFQHINTSNSITISRTEALLQIVKQCKAVHPTSSNSELDLAWRKAWSALEPTSRLKAVATCGECQSSLSITCMLIPTPCRKHLYVRSISASQVPCSGSKGHLWYVQPIDPRHCY